jgi:hypothetical protein
VVYAVLVFGAVTPAVLMLSADLRISDVSAVPQGAVAVLPGVHGSHN